MTDLPQDEAARLFALDESLRAEADAMLAESGLGAIVREAGYQAVGSYAMRTMTWRDLDFERCEEPEWGRHWEVGTQSAETGWCVRLQCVNVYREAWPQAQPGFGFYWGLRVADPRRAGSASPGDPTVWKLDLWTARPAEFAPAARRRETWASLMTDDRRCHVLAIKEALRTAPEYGKSLLSVHIYEAVLERGVHGVEEFRQWWRAKYAGTSRI
jgi:hypothetical protein